VLTAGEALGDWLTEIAAGDAQVAGRG
jgi:hypothetical protein